MSGRFGEELTKYAVRPVLPKIPRKSNNSAFGGILEIERVRTSYIRLKINKAYTIFFKLGSSSFTVAYSLQPIIEIQTLFRKSKNKCKYEVHTEHAIHDISGGVF